VAEKDPGHRGEGRRLTRAEFFVGAPGQVVELELKAGHEAPRRLSQGGRELDELFEGLRGVPRSLAVVDDDRDDQGQPAGRRLLPIEPPAPDPFAGLTCGNSKVEHQLGNCLSDPRQGAPGWA